MKYSGFTPVDFLTNRYGKAFCLKYSELCSKPTRHELTSGPNRVTSQMGSLVTGHIWHELPAIFPTEYWSEMVLLYISMFLIRKLL